MVRNITQGIGAFAKYDPHAGGVFQEPSTIPAQQSTNVTTPCAQLRSPAWPEDILGAIDREKAERGRVVFEKKCANCHADQKREEPLKYLRVTMTPVKDLKTDGNMVANADHRELRVQTADKKKLP